MINWTKLENAHPPLNQPLLVATAFSIAVEVLGFGKPTYHQDPGLLYWTNVGDFNDVKYWALYDDTTRLGLGLPFDLDF